MRDQVRLGGVQRSSPSPAASANARKREILILGATGGTGRALVDEALASGFGVTILARDGHHARHLFNGQVSRLTIVEGDALSPDAIQNALFPDLDAVVCSLGIYQRRPGHDDLARATTYLVSAMQAAGVRRLVCISSLGVGDSRGQGDFITRLIQKTALRHTLADKELQEAAIRQSELDWTLIRPTRLLDGDSPPGYQCWTGAQPPGKMPWAVTRTLVARLALDCLDDPESIGKAINVTGSAATAGNGG